MVMEDSDNWQTVKTKEKRSKPSRVAQDENQKPKQLAHATTGEPNEYGAPPVTAPSAPGKKWDMTLVHVEPEGNVVERELEVQDSEWEVA